MSFCRWLLLLLHIPTSVFYLSICTAAENTATANDPAFTVMTLKGHLGQDELIKAKHTLDQFNTEEGNTKTLIIEINSTSGELGPVLEMAKKIYALHLQKQIQIIVFIEDSAVGPAAILPFLADELYVSLFVSWGAIPLGNEARMSTNILRNQVVSLIAPENPHAKLLKIIAAAMSDPSVKIVDDNGWKVATETKEASSFSLISSPGETLVINQNQLKDLGLTAGVISTEAFYQKFQFSKAQQEQLNVEPSSSLAISEITFEKQLEKHIRFNADGPNTIGRILIEERTSGISESTWLYVKKALEYYRTSKPAFIILELNTPGGEVFASQKISDALKEMDTQANIPVVAFINNWAISAGAMLAYSCRFIAITKDASMGAAEPVLAGQSGEMKEASEKINSALRTDFANRARFFDRNPYLAEGMVDKDIILVMRHGKIIKLDSDSQIRTTGADPDTLIKAKGKLLTLNAEQLMQYGVADLMVLPTQLTPITEAEMESGQWPAKKSLLFQAPFFAKIPQATIDTYQMDWKTRFFVILATPLVSSLLLLGLMFGIYMEMSSPGFGIPGTIALFCLFLIILSTLSLDIANWLEVILLFTGLAIVAIDLFLLPTFGLLGFIGTVFFLVGLFGMLLPGISSVDFDFDTKTWNTAGEAFLSRVAWLSGTFLAGIILMVLMGRFVTPRFAAWNRLVLTGSEQNASQGYIAGEDPKKLPQPGQKGEVLSTLRPAGKVIIDGTIYDAMSSGNFIEKGTPVVVAHLEGSVIVVAEQIFETNK